MKENAMKRTEQRMREDCEEAIEQMKKEAAEAEKVDSYRKAAIDLRCMHDSFIEAGFNEEQAWELTKMFFNNTTTKRGLF